MQGMMMWYSKETAIGIYNGKQYFALIIRKRECKPLEDINSGSGSWYLCKKKVQLMISRNKQ